MEPVERILTPLKIVSGKAITDWASIYASAKRASPGFIEVSPLAIKDMRPLSSWLLENVRGNGRPGADVSD